MQKNKSISSLKRSQQQSRKFHKRLEHKEDEVILTDKVEWNNLHPQKHIEEERTSLGKEVPFPEKPWGDSQVRTIAMKKRDRLWGHY